MSLIFREIFCEQTIAACVGLICVLTKTSIQDSIVSSSIKVNYNDGYI